MPLKLDFKAGDKLVINGAVLENIGTNAKILVHNESAILREKEILSVADTSTPATRVYFALQCAYMFPQKKDEYLTLFTDFLKEFVTACPSTKPIADEIEMFVDDDKIYKALKHTQKLIGHQAKVLKSLEEGVEEVSAEVIEASDAESEESPDGGEEGRIEAD
ncbi:MAG: flagellar biosynthesis repressor FlbT [Rhodospirillales bacterium]